MNKKRLFLDMDGTIARFHDNILDGEGHVQIELMYESGFFRKLEPFQNMIDGMKLFIEKHPEVEVYSLSAAQQGDPPGFVRQKDEWLDEFLPEIDRNHRIYPECGVPKSGYIPGGISIIDYLIDDYNKNLKEWVQDGGKSIKCKNNINHKGTGKFGGDIGNLWTGDMVSNLDSPEIICEQIEVFMGLTRDRRENERVLEPEEEFVEEKKEALYEKWFESKHAEDFDGKLPLEEELSYADRAIAMVAGKEKLMITAYPVKDNYPPVEIDISRRDLEKVLKEVYKANPLSVEEFLSEYIWDNGDQIKDFLESHPGFCQDGYKVTDFADAKYAVIITNCWEHDAVGIYEQSVKSLYPEVIDESFVNGLLEKGLEGSRILVTNIENPTWNNVIYDGVLGAGLAETFQNLEKTHASDTKKTIPSLDKKVREARGRVGLNSNEDYSSRSEKNMEMS